MLKHVFFRGELSTSVQCRSLKEVLPYYQNTQMLVQGPLSIALALLSVQSNLTVIVRNIAALWAKAFLPCYTYSSWQQFG